jgi:hypothetical protein
MLAGELSGPFRNRQQQGAHARGLIDDIDDLGGAPDQSPL